MDTVHIHTTEAKVRALGLGMNLNELRTSIPELESLANHKVEAAEAFKDAITVAAIKTNIIPGVLTQYIMARVNDTVKKKSQSAEQLSLLFGEDIA